MTIGNVSWLASASLLFGVSLLSVSACAQEPGVRPAASPIEWSAAGSYETDTGLTRAAAGYLGLRSDSTLVSVEANFRDQRPFGGDYSGAIFVVSAEALSVSSFQGATTTVTMHVALAADGRLLCAFTEPAPLWVVPGMSERQAEDEARESGWSFAPSAADPKSNVGDVIGAFWSYNGLGPSDLGQIILRPRGCSTSFATRRTSAHGVPQAAPEVVPAGEVRVEWLIEALGGVTHAGSDGDYFTGLLSRFDDETLTPVRAIYLP